MPKRPKLLPCPFCGDEHPGIWKSEMTRIAFVSCTDCRAESHHHRTVTQAVAAWNRRTPPPPRERDQGEG